MKTKQQESDHVSRAIRAIQVSLTKQMNDEAARSEARRLRLETGHLEPEGEPIGSLSRPILLCEKSRSWATSLQCRLVFKPLTYISRLINSTVTDSNRGGVSVVVETPIPCLVLEGLLLYS